MPFEPKIPGLQEFSGQVFHSHTYRTPDKYKGKSVLILGASSSGVDLAVEIASVADKVRWRLLFVGFLSIFSIFIITENRSYTHCLCALHHCP